MNFDHYFCDIGIYRITKEKFIVVYDRDLAKHFEWVKRASGTNAPLSENLRMHAEQNFWRRYGAPWRYNQVVGWIRLFATDASIRGELWMTSAKRLQRRQLHQISHMDKAFEMHCWPEQSSMDIYKDLENELLEFQKRFRNGRLTLDLECLRTIAPFVDWRKMLQVDKIPSQP
jgi:hypothetical protein